MSFLYKLDNSQTKLYLKINKTKMIVEYLSDNEKLVDEINNLDKNAWPVFLTKDTIVKKYWKGLYKKYQEYQLLLKIEDEYVGIGNSAPIYWNGKTLIMPRRGQSPGLILWPCGPVLCLLFWRRDCWQ